MERLLNIAQQTEPTRALVPAFIQRAVQHLRVLKASTRKKLSSGSSSYAQWSLLGAQRLRVLKVQVAVLVNDLSKRVFGEEVRQSWQLCSL